ncbi:MAG TPA: CvpA family protein [Gammaproteobacteria bacterium]|nr:CvpA family protein [Gammaproteobacteria bacterium]
MNLQNFNWADYTIAGIIIFSTLISLVRGFIREVLSLVIWIVALWVAYQYYTQFAARFLGSISSESLRGPLAFLIIFLGIVIIGAIINFLIGGLVYKTGLSGTDRVLGLVFGLARGVLLVAVLILAAQITAVTKESWWKESQLIPQFDGIAQWIYSILPAEIQKVGKEATGAATAPQPSESVTQQPSAPSTPETQQPVPNPVVPKPNQ